MCSLVLHRTEKLDYNGPVDGTEGLGLAVFYGPRSGARTVLLRHIDSLEGTLRTGWALTVGSDSFMNHVVTSITCFMPINLTIQNLTWRE